MKCMIHFLGRVLLFKAVDKIENLFKLIILAQMLLFGIMLCVYGSALLATITEKGTSSPTRICYLISVVISCIIQISFYFITGQILADQSEAIYYAVYECEWIKLKSNEVRSLALVMMRAKQPFLITTEKLFPMTLMTFDNQDMLQLCIIYTSKALMARPFNTRFTCSLIWILEIITLTTELAINV
nr:odorant receptor 49b-like [Nomia melanderi]